MVSARVLNRTLLERQHLLERATVPALELVEHLVGLQAQEAMSPYLSLWSRLHDFDPLALSDALETRAVVRLLLMRGTIHLVTPADALVLRSLVQPVLDRTLRTSPTTRAAADVDREKLAAATVAELKPGPVGLREIGELLVTTFPDVPADALAKTARVAVPLVQVPPRGTWRRSGGVVHQSLHEWLRTEADLPPVTDEARAELVRRFLRAFGPATPADFTTWSGLPRLRETFTGLDGELTRYRDDSGRELVDLADLPLADEDTPAPVRLLGRYDNVWLAHQGRDRVTGPEQRRRWMGSNGGVSATVFVDGHLEGLWHATPSRTVEVELFRRLTSAESDDLDREVAALEGFLRR